MKWCVIGAGGIADRRTIPAILKDKDNVIVALMDRSEAVAKKTGEKKTAAGRAAVFDEAL